MRIKKVTANNRKKSIDITVGASELSLPYSKLDLKPSSKNTITNIFVDKELGKEAITYVLESGKEDSVHLDSFLNYNQDPTHLRERFLFELTIASQKAIKSSSISKNEICRKLKTSPAQLSRLLDQTNKRKSVDKMLELLAVLDIEVKPIFSSAA